MLKLNTANVGKYYINGGCYGEKDYAGFDDVGVRGNGFVNGKYFPAKNGN